MRKEKLSVTVPKHLAAFVESYRATHGVRTKSEVVERALKLLRDRELECAYEAAAVETDSAWDTTLADGLSDESC